jgi:hypothetical protein
MRRSKMSRLTTSSRFQRGHLAPQDEAGLRLDLLEDRRVQEGSNTEAQEERLVQMAGRLVQAVRVALVEALGSMVGDELRIFKKFIEKLENFLIEKKSSGDRQS